MPEVSVIVPTHNRPDMLANALNSIAQQTFRDFEVIVVNDAGEDVEQVIEQYDKLFAIDALTHLTNRGLAAARNTGVQVARGRFIAYLDDDDIFYPNHLKLLHEALMHGDEPAVYSEALRAFQIEGKTGYQTMERRLAGANPYSFERLLVGNITPVNCVMHEAACLEKAGLFDESLKVMEDWDLWIRIGEHHPFRHLPRVTCEFSWRGDGSSMSSSLYRSFLDTANHIHTKYAHLAARHPGVSRLQRLTPLRTLDESTYCTVQNQGPVSLPRLEPEEVPGLNLCREMLDRIKDTPGIEASLIGEYLESMPPRPFFLRQLVEVLERRNDLAAVEEQIATHLGSLESEDYCDHISTGICASALGHHELAAASFENALELAVDPKIATIKLAHAYRALGKFEQALHHFAKVTEYDQSNVNPKYAMVELYARLDRKSEGLDHMRRMESDHPEEVKDFPFKLALHWKMLGDLERARSLFVSVPPESPDYEQAMRLASACLREPRMTGKEHQPIENESGDNS